MGIVTHCLHLSSARSVRKLPSVIIIIMLRFVAASCLVAAACGQFVDPKNAKILKEQRFNAGDGRHGAAFAQQDGTVFREESTADGERIGQYPYIDQDGNTITVRYTAGKDGFRILEGAHIPEGANGQNSAPFAAQAAPVPVSSPVQPAAPVVQTVPQTIDYDYADEPVDPNFNPFINPHDPTHRDFRFNTNGAQFAPQSAPASTRNFGVPPCADCAGVNPFINPFDASHQQAGLLAGHQAGVQFRPQPTATPVRQAPVQAPVQPTFNVRATTAAPRFFPPGNLKLNRFETGFNFDFSSQ